MSDKELDHPCKNTCSGWEQGRQRGLSEQIKLRMPSKEEIQNEAKAFIEKKYPVASKRGRFSERLYMAFCSGAERILERIQADISKKDEKIYISKEHNEKSDISRRVPRMGVQIIDHDTLTEAADFAFENILKCDDESKRGIYRHGYGDGYRRGVGAKRVKIKVPKHPRQGPLMYQETLFEIVEQIKRLNPDLEVVEI